VTHNLKIFFLRSHRCTLQSDVFLVVCQVPCDKVVDATPSEGQLFIVMFNYYILYHYIAVCNMTKWDLALP